MTEKKMEIFHKVYNTEGTQEISISTMISDIEVQTRFKNGKCCHVGIAKVLKKKEKGKGEIVYGNRVGILCYPDDHWLFYEKGSEEGVDLTEVELRGAITEGKHPKSGLSNNVLFYFAKGKLHCVAAFGENGDIRNVHLFNNNECCVTLNGNGEVKFEPNSPQARNQKLHPQRPDNCL